MHQESSLELLHWNKMSHIEFKEDSQNESVGMHETLLFTTVHLITLHIVTHSVLWNNAVMYHL